MRYNINTHEHSLMPSDTFMRFSIFVDVKMVVEYEILSFSHGGCCGGKKIKKLLTPSNNCTHNIVDILSLKRKWNVHQKAY
ncbi:hypothetical protein T01_13058 [Trichinella spiralis]|uniref:Uncharacterized protein n=1 Tax=Trichinella spiralis TaxID=6334 RepID=A0A0V1BHR0_TRISP|nr:hypothetical protein T01_13058 [Trichinella spiralis]